MNNHARYFWSGANREQLVELAASRLAASEIAAVLLTSRQSVVTACSQRGIDLVLDTPAELEEKRAKIRAYEKIKLERKRAARRASEIPARPRKPSTIPGTSQSSVVYRNQLPRIGEMTKNELRAMLAQAVRNTAEMQDAA